MSDLSRELTYCLFGIYSSARSRKVLKQSQTFLDIFLEKEINKVIRGKIHFSELYIKGARFFYDPIDEYDHILCIGVENDAVFEMMRKIKYSILEKYKSECIVKHNNKFFGEIYPDYVNGIVIAEIKNTQKDANT